MPHHVCQVDGKKRMDDAVRDACGQLAAYVVEDLAGPLRRMCVDVRELLRVPNEATHDELRLALGSLSDDGLKNLARQPAVRPERVRVSMISRFCRESHEFDALLRLCETECFAWSGGFGCSRNPRVREGAPVVCLERCYTVSASAPHTGSDGGDC
jgi:hypothetical protein